MQPGGRSNVLSTRLFPILIALAALGPTFPFLRAEEGAAGRRAALAQQDSESSEGENAKEPEGREDSGEIRAISNLVTTPVTVIDPSGEFAYGLTEDEFEVYDSGVRQRIESFESEVRPVAVVIVVQTNRAVAPLLDQMQPLASLFSELMLGPKGQAAVITFDDRVRVAQDFSNSSDELSKTLQALAPLGDRARLNDALMRAVALQEKWPKVNRRVVVVFSHGSDDGSLTEPAEVVRRATGSEVTIYGLAFSRAQMTLAKKPNAPPPDPLDTSVARPVPPGTVPTPSSSARIHDNPVPAVDILTAAGQMIRSIVASSRLEYYAGYTGGVSYSHGSKRSLQDQLSRTASEIHSQYEIAYVPSTFNQPGFHRIEVRVKYPGFKVRARAGYFFRPPVK